MTKIQEFVAPPSRRQLLFIGAAAFILGAVFASLFMPGERDEAYAHGKLFGECNAIAADRVAKTSHQAKPQFEGTPFVADDAGCAVQYGEGAW